MDRRENRVSNSTSIRLPHRCTARAVVSFSVSRSLASNGSIRHNTISLVAVIVQTNRITNKNIFNYHTLTYIYIADRDWLHRRHRLIFTCWLRPQYGGSFYFIFYMNLNFIKHMQCESFRYKSTWGWPYEAETCRAEKKGLILINKLSHVTVFIYIISYYPIC
jgi:hypothetical protein